MPPRTPPPARLFLAPWRWLAALMLGLWLTGCASLPSEVDRPVSSALADPTETRIGRAVQARAAQAETHN
ncbi:MAG: hypothetical protein B7Y28_23930, partial [Polaromonas sp. 16-63-31]